MTRPTASRTPPKPAVTVAEPVAVTCFDGEVVHVTATTFDEAARKALTGSLCLELAVAVAPLVDGIVSIVATGSRRNVGCDDSTVDRATYQGLHAVVELSDGRLFDADGVHDPDAITTWFGPGAYRMLLFDDEIVALRTVGPWSRTDAEAHLAADLAPRVVDAYATDLTGAPDTPSARPGTRGW